MADFACNSGGESVEFKAARKVLETPAEPRHNDPEMEDRAMPYGKEYGKRDGACNRERSSNWKPIGALVADLVRKAVQQQDAAE